MKYVAIKDFADLQDNKRLYRAGEAYPREGLEVSKERLAELSSSQNKAGFCVIKAVEEPNEETPTPKPTQANSAKKTRKTATKTAK